MTMDGSSRSDSSRGLNSSGVCDRNPSRYVGSDSTRLLPADNTTHAGLSRAFEDRNRRECGGDVSLRQWLGNPERVVDSIECLHIFSQIVEIVNLAHSQGIVVHNVRPSCFVMSSLNRVSFIESASCSDSGSDSYEDVCNSLIAEIKDGGPPNESETSCLQSYSDVHAASNVEQAEEKEHHHFPMKQILLMEMTWYTSPEEVDGAPSSCASDIYRLGVLLFELFCTFSLAEEKSATMSSLRHRLLPPQLLLKWPKEASFCLWLLHPEPTSRPKMGELLESEFLSAPRESIEEREAAIELREKIEEEELLLEFLLLIQQRKQEAAANLQETISFLSSDIEEVAKLQTAIKNKSGSTHKVIPSMNTIADNEDSGNSSSRKRVRPALQNEEDGEHQKSGALIGNEGRILSQNSRLMKNFKKLESAYYLARRRAAKPNLKPPFIRHTAPISSSERSSVNNNLSVKERYNDSRQNGWINPFLDGLCKYLAYSKIKVKADLKQGDLLNSSNLVCSLSFDRDGEFFATAGVNKKIKVFEYDSITKEDRDIHYPVVEMSSRSKLSSICWNGYIKSQIASSNFDGVVQVWDVSRSQVFMEMREHERRVWSVDYSLADPTLLASGSDDCSVKLWNINQGVSVGTIKTKANVCCVQFPTDSSNYLAFGSADHRIYYYDLRNSKMPLFTMIGHNKTVSYIKFVDSTNLVSASTDNTLKLWDLSMCTSRVLDSPLQSFTGHMNVKNFVGLSVSEGYIATGSETNEVYIYHKALPMHTLSYKFNTTDPISGDEVADASQFISSVCWRGQSATLVAANSMGHIKLLEMV